MKRYHSGIANEATMPASTMSIIERMPTSAYRCGTSRYMPNRNMKPLLLIVLSFLVGAAVYYAQVFLGVFNIRVVTYTVDNAVSFTTVTLVYWYLMVIRSKKQGS